MHRTSPPYRGPTRAEQRSTRDRTPPRVDQRPFGGTRQRAEPYEPSRPHTEPAERRPTRIDEIDRLWVSNKALQSHLVETEATLRVAIAELRAAQRALQTRVTSVERANESAARRIAAIETEQFEATLKRPAE
jgi:hypothetical protein